VCSRTVCKKAPSAERARSKELGDNAGNSELRQHQSATNRNGGRSLFFPGKHNDINHTVKMTVMPIENKQQDISGLILLSSLRLGCLTCKLRNCWPLEIVYEAQVVSREEKISCHKRRGAIFQGIKHSNSDAKS
jgi:hypothetical protein